MNFPCEQKDTADLKLHVAALSLKRFRQMRSISIAPAPSRTRMN